MERRACESLSDAEVRGDPAAQADALHLLASAHALCGDRAAALTVLHQAIAASAAASGETSVRTAIHRAALGTLLIDAGERSAAQDQLTRAHTAFEHDTPTAPTAHVMVLDALAGLARASGDYGAASAWLRAALARGDHPGVAPAVANITRHNQASLALATAMRLS